MRGLAAKKKQSQVYRLLVDQDLDVLAVQETKVAGEEETGGMVLRFTSKYFVMVSHAVGTSAGCIIFVKKLQGLVIQNYFSCVSGRVVSCDFSLGERDWRVVCVYAPNAVNDRVSFFSEIKKHLNVTKQLVLLGDFNCVLSGRDRTTKIGSNDKSAEFLKELIQEHEIVDVAECLEGEREVQYTHFQGSSHARLDRIYVSLQIIPTCNIYNVLPVSFSDHCLVKCDVGFKKRSNSFNWDLWKLNVMLLRDESFINFVSEAIRDVKLDGNNNIGVDWELLKQRFKIKAIERSSVLKYREKMRESALKATLQKIIALENKQPGLFKDDLIKIKQQLEQFEEHRYRGALVRARAEAWAVGETPTKRALSIEKTHARRNEIDVIEENDQELSDRESITCAFNRYYQRLFAYKPVDIKGYKENYLSRMPQLSAETKSLLEAPITLAEIENAIDNLSPNKSPGPDGLSAAFYKMFKNELVPLLKAVFDVAFANNALPPSFSEAHTVLIPKTDQKAMLRLVTSYRPISLTNTDYKVLMKVLAGRLQSVIKDLVGPHQTCGIKGRTIATNIHTMRSILECCDDYQYVVAIMQIDLEKAFDFVPHDILLLVLEHVNVGSIITDGVALAYRNCSTRLIINKTLGAPIKIERSVRQGCPLSPLLFAIYLESFCLAIIQNSSIRGFKLMEAEVKLLAYADDVAVCCTSKESITEVTTIVKHFGNTTGSTANWSKCLGFWHGEWQSTPETFANIRWIKSPAKYLGVPLEHYRRNEDYWLEEAKRIKEKTTNWKGTHLSMFAKATVCNLFLISKIWYVMQVLYCSRRNVQKIHRVFAVFIWASEWERCSRMNLFKRVKDGGLGLSHLFVKQLVNRFTFFRDVRDPFLRTMCQLRLSKHLPAYVVSNSSMPGSLRGYLREVVDSVRFLSVRFSNDYLFSVSRKKLYRDTLDMIIPVPMYRAINSGGQGHDVLKRVKKMQVQPGTKSFFFKLHTGTLPVRGFLQEKGFYLPWGANCLICKQLETIDHVFLHCWEGVYFWDVLQRTLQKELPLNSLGIRFLTVENEDGLPLDLIMLMGLHCLWRARMAGFYCEPDRRPARQLFREDVSKFIDVIKDQECPPDWLTRIEPLATLKEF